MVPTPSGGSTTNSNTISYVEAIMWFDNGIILKRILSAVGSSCGCFLVDADSSAIGT